MNPIDLGSRRELLLDDAMLLSRGGAQFVLHTPEAADCVFRQTRPEEGLGMSYPTLLRDHEGRYRLYYIAHVKDEPVIQSLRARYSAAARAYAAGERLPAQALANYPHYHVCCALSDDGIHWESAALHEFEVTPGEATAITYALPGDILDNFCPGLDTNPDCPPQERYKAMCERVIDGRAVLNALVSEDGFHWRDLGTVCTKGTFDTLNTWFYDPLQQVYHVNLRGWHTHTPSRHLGESGVAETTVPDPTMVRAIFTCASADFRTWSDPEPLDYGDAPDYQMYTNNIQAYYRAPHLFLGFPTRYYERMWSPVFDQLPSPEIRREKSARMMREGTALTDCVFMSSRDGLHYRRWDYPAFIGPRAEKNGAWFYGDAYLGYGMLQTPSAFPGAADELSLYAFDGAAGAVRRYLMRQDGFVSLRGLYPAADVVTKLLTFTGSRLLLNYASCAAGGIRAELLDAQRNPIPGYTLAECDELIGDTVDRAVTWNGNADVSSLIGKPVFLRLALCQCDLYSFVFAD